MGPVMKINFPLGEPMGTAASKPVQRSEQLALDNNFKLIKEGILNFHDRPPVSLYQGFLNLVFINKTIY